MLDDDDDDDVYVYAYVYVYVHESPEHFSYEPIYSFCHIHGSMTVICSIKRRRKSSRSRRVGCVCLCIEDSVVLSKEL